MRASDERKSVSHNGGKNNESTKGLKQEIRRKTVRVERRPGQVVRRGKGEKASVKPRIKASLARRGGLVPGARSSRGVRLKKAVSNHWGQQNKKKRSTTTLSRRGRDTLFSDPVCVKGDETCQKTGVRMYPRVSVGKNRGGEREYIEH